MNSMSPKLKKVYSGRRIWKGCPISNSVDYCGFSSSKKLIRCYIKKFEINIESITLRIAFLCILNQATLSRNIDNSALLTIVVLYYKYSKN